jgi:Sigma-70 region 2
MPHRERPLSQERKRAMNFGRAVTSELARRRFAEMVLPHLDDAYGLAHWLTGNRADAEDVVQDASIRALPSLDAAVIERAARVVAFDRAQYGVHLACQEPVEDRLAHRRRAAVGGRGR